MIFGYVAFLDAEFIGKLATRAASVIRVRRSMAEPVSAPQETTQPPAQIATPAAATLRAFPDKATTDVEESIESARVSTVKFTSQPVPTKKTTSTKKRRQYVADALFYVARSKQQRANVRAYFQRHKLPCKVLRGAAELVELTVNLRKATIVLRAKDFSLAELQFWCDELVQTNPDGLFRVFILPNTKNSSSTAGLEVPPRIHFCLLYTSPSPRDRTRSRMPSSA